MVFEGCKRESPEPQAPLQEQVQGRIFLKNEVSRIVKVETEIVQLKSFSVPELKRSMPLKEKESALARSFFLFIVLIF